MTDIHIPPEALEAGARAVAGNLKTEWSRMLKEDKDWCRAAARAAFTAMVEAWPDAGMSQFHEDAIILPLTETPDGEP